MSYLVIGGAGFLGSNIVRSILSQPDHPHVTVLEPLHADISRLRDCQVTVIRGMLSNTNLIERLLSDYHFTHVLHLVSTMTPASSYEDFQEELVNIVHPTLRLIGLCRRYGVRFVYFSSCAIYGNKADDRPFCEHDPLLPISYYGLSKLLIEEYIRYECRTGGLQYLIFRPSNPFGPGQNIHGRQGLVAVAVGKMQRGEPITIWGDGSVIRDYIYIEDLAKAVVAILCSDAENKAINIGSGEGCSVNDILRHIEQATQQTISVVYAERHQGDVRSVVLDTSLMRQYYAKPLTPLSDGIRKFIGFLRTYYL